MASTKRPLEEDAGDPPSKRHSEHPISTLRAISPRRKGNRNGNGNRPNPSTSAIEAGKATITDHLAHFTKHLAQHAVPSPQTPLSMNAYAASYNANADSLSGAHFVIHQHDHPVAGLHYDLRLQINPTSSASWAIMYGLPGDANSSRLNRNATETRIHSLWNHLIETSSRETGSLLIWDTGTYTVLPRRSKYAPAVDPDSQSDSEPEAPASQQALLEEAFQNRKIKLRLKGAKLPDPYVIYLRLTRDEDAAGRMKGTGSRRRRRLKTPDVVTSEEEEVEESVEGVDEDAATAATDYEKELLELEDARVRCTNAYPGAHNSIGSVHQRRWYLSLDREASGFVKVVRDGEITWEQPGQELKQGHGRLSYPFYVRGSQHETSVLTGRTGDQVLRDEGVFGFVARKGWFPVLK